MSSIPVSPGGRRPSVFKGDPCEGSDCRESAEIPTWLCVSCDCTYCDVCWTKQGPHKQGKVGQNGKPHEKTSKVVFQRLKSIFEPPEKTSELLKLHTEDEETLWFGVEKNEEGKPIFIDNGRYASLMARTKQPIATERYPLLVSFVGQTGAGKSTLIKMLVSLKESDLSQGIDDLFKTPISGSVKDDRSPTSGDVHLYVDPQTAFSDLPMLYADCEGLEGGEVPPRAKQFKHMLKQSSGRVVNLTTPRVLQLPPDKSETGLREYAVKHVYPRLLYTFSDVIVFVLRNTRTFESVALRLLLEWAASSIESSVNQPALPQAIIVLNASDTSLDNEEWDVKTATARLMSHVRDTVQSEPIKTFADKWTKQGKTITSAEQLIKCYYADVRVIRIPSKGSSMLIKQQVDELHLQLAWACQASFKAKFEARQYCTTEELNRYLQAAFDHFTSKPGQPFNFVDIALKADPIPQSFTEHIYALACTISKEYQLGNPTQRPIFLGKLSRMVASCILLDCVRYKRPGKPEDLFDRHYAQSCSGAIERYINRHLQCSFVRTVRREEKPCVNTKLYHDKGHQSRSGKIIGHGSFTSTVSVEALPDEWLATIRNHLIDMEASVRKCNVGTASSSQVTREKIMYEQHRTVLLEFFGNDPNLGHSHHSCYSCLMEQSQHPLPCGHMLCTFCVQMLGHESDKNTVTVDICPFDSKTQRRISPCSIRFKPKFAGVRILSLDGGGMRGIVELESLRAIEKVLGKDLPVQAFFDLVVGTSTGGIIALGLGVKQWTVDQCITRFVQLCEKAFTPRELDGVKVLRSLSFLVTKSRYKTKPLYESLRQSFGSDPLYGHVPEDTLVRDNKVCVTATSGTVDSAIVIGNYTRQSEDAHWYKFQAGDCMKVWEAACATSAAPKYFKKFECRNDKIGFQEFYDGALYFNNPVRIAFNERRFLWPDVADTPPDIVLSLGTGQNAAENAKGDSPVGFERSSRAPEKSRALCLPEGKIAKLRKGIQKSNGRRKNVIKNLVEALSNMFDSILDAEKEFRIFKAEHAHAGVSDRFFRLNPDLETNPPDLADTTRMAWLQEKVQSILKTPAYELLTERIAFRLVASSFYFVKEAELEHDERSLFYTCKGRLACRFEGNASDMKDLLRHLGEFFRRQSTLDFKPYFIITDGANPSVTKKILVDRPISDDMIADANFHLAEDLNITVTDKLSSTTIALCLQPSRTKEPEIYPISGFPRFLVTEDASTASRLQKRAERIKSKMDKSELLVGDSLFELLESEQARPMPTEIRRTLRIPFVDSESDVDTEIGSQSQESDHAERTTSLSSMTSGHSEEALLSAERSKSSVVGISHGKRTPSHQSDPSASGGVTSPDSSNLGSHSKSIADFRNLKERREYKTMPDHVRDEKASKGAFRPRRGAVSEGVVVVDAMELMLKDDDAAEAQERTENEVSNEVAKFIDGGESDSDWDT